MYDMGEARALRRGFLVGGLAAIATGLFGTSLSTPGALAQTAGLFGFTPVPLSKEDTVVVPEGYKAQILAPSGTRLTGAKPAFVPGRTTGARRACRSAATMTAEENWSDFFVNADAEMPRHDPDRRGQPARRESFVQIVHWRYDGADHSQPTFLRDLFVIAGTPRNSLVFNGDVPGDDNTFACPDGLWCDAQSRLWIQTDRGDIGPAQDGPVEPFGMNAMRAADTLTGEVRCFLTGPWGPEIAGVISTPGGTSMFVNVQHPGGHAAAEQFAANHFGSGFPDYKAALGDARHHPR